MHLSSNDDDKPDKLCGHLSCDSLWEGSQTHDHRDCVGTFINIAHSFQQMCTTCEWLNSDEQMPQKVVWEDIAKKFEFLHLIDEKCGNCKEKASHEPLSMSDDFVKFDFDQNSLCHQHDHFNCGLAAVVSCMRLVDASVGVKLDLKWKCKIKKKDGLTTAFIPKSILPDVFVSDHSCLSDG